MFKKIGIVILLSGLFLKPTTALTAGFGDVTGKFQNFGTNVGATTYGTPESLVGVLIDGALTMAGLVFFVLMIYAGYLWFGARGEDEPVQKAQKIIKTTIIGFILVASSYAITIFVGKRLENTSAGVTQSTKCTALGPDWQCGDIDYCLKLVDGFNLDNDIDKKRSFCDENPDQCRTGMCSGGKNNICCRNAGPNKNNNPTNFKCLAKCEASSFKNDDGSYNYSFNGVMWVSEAAVESIENACNPEECKIEYPFVVPGDEASCKSYDEDDFNC